MMDGLIGFTVILFVAFLLGAPVLALSHFVGISGWQGFVLGAITGACNVGFVLFVLLFFKLDERDDIRRSIRRTKKS